MRTLVTGGNGFIGSHVVDTLLGRGRDVLILDRSRDAQSSFGVDVTLGDIRDPVAVTEAMAHCDSWIHLAGVLGTQETIANPRPAAETNILGGLNVLEAAAQYRLPGVNIAVGNWWESNTYSITKTTVERFAAMYRQYRGVPVTTVRALNAYGPGQVPAAPYGPSKVRKIMPSFICRALAGVPVEVYGDGRQVMDMIHVRDVAEVLVRALEYTEAHGGLPEPVEAGTGRITRVREIAHAVIDAVGDGDVKHLPMRAGETPNAVVLGNPDTLKPLGVTAADLVSMDDGVRETVEWYRTHWLPGWLDANVRLDREASDPLRCPIHGRPDCSPLLNGCTLVEGLALHPRDTVDAAVAAVAATYAPASVIVWWLSWLRQYAEQRRAWLDDAPGLAS